MRAGRISILFLLWAVVAFSYAPSSNASTRRPPAHNKRIFDRPAGVFRRLNPLVSRVAQIDLDTSPREDPLAEARQLSWGTVLTPKKKLSPRIAAWSAVGISGYALAILVSNKGKINQSVTDSLMWLLHSYKQAIVSRPLETKVATGAILAVIGDALAQAREPGEYSPRRAVSFAAFDSCYRTFQHNAFPTIIRVCQGDLLANALTSVSAVAVGENLRSLFAAVESTMMYQFGVIPFFYYPVFFTFTGFIQGLTLRETFQRAKANFLPCWKRNLMFWIPIQLFMFGVVGENWQIPFVCVMGILWSTILSITAGRAKDSPTEPR